MADLSYMYSSIEFVDGKTATSSTTTMDTMSPKLAAQQLNALLKSQLKSHSLSSTPTSSVSSSSSCSPNSFSNQIEVAEQTLMTTKKQTCLHQLPSVINNKLISAKHTHQNQKPIMANLREVLQATHHLRTNSKNLDATKRELLSKLEATMKKRLDSSSSFGNLESLVELLKQNENSRSSAIHQHQNIRVNNSNLVQSTNKSQHQRLRSFRSSSPNKLFTETTKSLSGGAQDSFRKFYLAAENIASNNGNKLESLKKNFNQRRNSIDLIPFHENDLNHKSNCTKIQNKAVKPSISFNNHEKIIDEKLITCLNNNNNNNNIENVVPLESLGDGDEEICRRDLNGNASDSSCNNWNYDELNELRMKFISLLSDSSKKDDETIETTDASSHLMETKEALLGNESNNQNVEMSKGQLLANKYSQFSLNQENSNKVKEKSATRMAPLELEPMTSDELLKIESFYRSYGTALNIGGSCACLYTMNNTKTCTTPSYLVKNDLKTHHHHHNPKRSSFISSKHIQNSSTSSVISKEIDTNILMDFMESKHQKHVSVYHRGVPLWLFNSGVNPRRPTRQLKFTLAERGTGFILWQDRIDAQSDLKIYSITKADSKLINYSTYLEKIHELSALSPQDMASKIEKSLDLFSSMLITFRASDKKTTVFIKFDTNAETAKFYDYYLQVIKRISVDIKQKTKSLPVGITSSHLNQFNKNMRKSQHLNLQNESQASNEFYFNYSKEQQSNETTVKLGKISSRNSPKRRSFYLSNTPPSSSKGKKAISKSEISAPANPKHIINIKLFDRPIYYTLSKLIPEPITKTLTEHLSNKMTPSPTYSLISSLSSHSSSILNNTSFGGLTNSLVEGASIMLNPKSPTSSSQFTSSSSSSLLSMPHPIMLLNNNNNNSNNLKSNFFNETSMAMRNFEPMSNQRTVK